MQVVERDCRLLNENLHRLPHTRHIAIDWQISLLCNLIFFMSVELGNQLFALLSAFQPGNFEILQDNLFLSLGDG